MVRRTKNATVKETTAKRGATKRKTDQAVEEDVGTLKCVDNGVKCSEKKSEKVACPVGRGGAARRRAKNDSNPKPPQESASRKKDKVEGVAEDSAHVEEDTTESESTSSSQKDGVSSEFLENDQRVCSDESQDSTDEATDDSESAVQDHVDDTDSDVSSSSEDGSSSQLSGANVQTESDADSDSEESEHTSAATESSDEGSSETSSSSDNRKEQLNESNKKANVTGRESKSDDIRANKENMTLFIKGLKKDVTESLLRSELGKHGKIKDLRIPKDSSAGKIRGFAYVVLEDKKSKKNILKLNGKSFLGSTLLVDENVNTSTVDGNRNKNLTVFIKSIPYNSTESELKEYLSKFGNVEKVSLPQNRTKPGRNLGFGFVEYADKKSYGKALKTEYSFCDRKLVVLPYEPSIKDEKRKGTGIDRNERYNYDLKRSKKSRCGEKYNQFSRDNLKRKPSGNKIVFEDSSDDSSS